MLKALKYRDKINEWFYLDDDDITVRRKKDGYHGRYKKDDIVKPYICGRGNGTKYFGVHIPGTRETIPMYWLLTVLRGIEFEDGSVIDHVDGNPENNERHNLRVTSQSVNCRNRKIRSDNKTGYPGVRYDNKSRLYIVRKQVNGERMYASAKSIDDAISKAKEFERLAELNGKGYIHRL
jgi:hypothetical protein